jgi:hypothetical protein
VTATLQEDAPAGSSVHILWKRFANTTTWTAVPAHGRGSRWSATIRGGGAGALFAVEVAQPGQDGWRYPDVLAQTPYVTLAPGAK